MGESGKKGGRKRGRRRKEIEGDACVCVLSLAAMVKVIHPSLHHSRQHEGLHTLVGLKSLTLAAPTALPVSRPNFPQQQQNKDNNK